MIFFTSSILERALLAASSLLGSSYLAISDSKAGRNGFVSVFSLAVEISWTLKREENYKMQEKFEILM